MSRHTPRASELTLEQKAALLSGGGFWSSAEIAEAGIRAAVLTDGPHGVRRQMQGTDHLGQLHSEPATCFPLAVAVGSSWNTDVAARIGSALAVEARALGVDVLLGPGVNIKRSPLGGRNFEYFSEDPRLTGELAGAYVRALQAGGVGASLKHFAANDQETDRMVVSADVDERTLREVHLAAFERVISTANPETVMCSYNRINGVYASENHWLLTEVLREEWGYDGLVVSDWGAVRDRTVSLQAGLDLAMPGPGNTYTEDVLSAVRAGTLDEAIVDRSAQRVLDVASRQRQEHTEFDVDAHHALARELATECAVLLRNEHGVLPVAAGTSILVVGEFAVEPRFQGGGSSHVNATQVDQPLAWIEAHAVARGCEIRFERGFDSAREDESLVSTAAEAAQTAHLAIIFAGNPESEESEGFDRTRLELAPAQVRLIREVAAVAPRTVVVLANGGVVSLEGWHDDVDAILEGFLLGQGGGHAIADLLFGVASPSGRLAESIPMRREDTPSYLTFPGEQGHVRYGEGVMVGYRHYETVGVATRYPFGHGLEYSTFSSADLDVVVTGPDTATARVTVTNTGGVAGKHVVQLYVATDAGPVLRPARQLAAFTKVDLAAGESSRVTLELDRSAFAYWDIDLHRFAVAGGTYRVQLAEHSSSIVSEHVVALEGDVAMASLSLQSTVGEWAAHPVVGNLVSQVLATLLANAESTVQPNSESGELPEVIGLMPMIQLIGVSGGALNVDDLLLLANSDSPS